MIILTKKTLDKTKTPGRKYPGSFLYALTKVTLPIARQLSIVMYWFFRLRKME